MKGSIPPTNRQHHPPSSMRAATMSGLVFVGSAMGGGIGSANRSAKEPEYKPRVIAPDSEAHQQQEAMREAVVQTLASNASFWAEELARWSEEFGKEAITKLPNLLD